MTGKKTEKKAYSKPQVTAVRLVAEEAVLANCKTGQTSGFSLCADLFESCGGLSQTS